MRLRKSVYLVSRLTLEEMIKRLSEHNSRKTKRVNTLLPTPSGAWFEIITSDAESITFQLYRPGYRRILPGFRSAKLGGIVIRGIIREGGEQVTSIEASSQVLIGDLLMTSLSMLVISGSLMIYPLIVFHTLGYPIGIAFPVVLVLAVLMLPLWRNLLMRIVDELFATLKETVHGSPTWTLVEDHHSDS